jgi:hypothetical protein
MASMHISRLVVAASAAVFLTAQNSAPEAEQASPEEAIARLCADIVKEKTDMIVPCTAAQTEAREFVMSWLGGNGLLDSDGNVDSLQLLEAQSDSFGGLNSSAASTAAICIEATSEWIGMNECINALDQSALLGGGPDPLDPMGGLPGDPFAPFPGTN